MGAPIDLRSDTVTRPTPTMRKAMAEAEVGDDWYGDDPTVNRLQERCAEVTGKEAAIYVATGTMANEIALHIFVRSGHLVVCEATSHVASVEVSSAAVLSGIAYRGLDAPRGQITAEMVGEALQPDPYRVRVVDLVSLENTHQVGGGTVMPIDEVRSIRKVSQEAGVPVYLDGARIFNAGVASGTPVEEYAAETDAMMFCLSKGLGAPIGSVLCGPASFVEEARRVKVLFGGAWRQAGIVAAAGLVALEEGPKRLHEDHENARRLAEGIAEVMPGAIDLQGVETNMVWVDTRAGGLPALDVRARLADRGILVNVIAGRVRLVTHRDVTSGDVEETIRAWQQVVAEMWAGGATE
jgi:threonine aldolase